MASPTALSPRAEHVVRSCANIVAELVALGDGPDGIRYAVNRMLAAAHAEDPASADEAVDAVSRNTDAVLNLLG